MTEIKPIKKRVLEKIVDQLSDPFFVETNLNREWDDISFNLTEVENDTGSWYGDREQSAEELAIFMKSRDEWDRITTGIIENGGTFDVIIKTPDLLHCVVLLEAVEEEFYNIINELNLDYWGAYSTKETLSEVLEFAKKSIRLIA